MVRAECPIAGCVYTAEDDSMVSALALLTAHAVQTHDQMSEARGSRQSEALKEGGQENKDSNDDSTKRSTGTGLGGVKKMTESEFQDGVAKLIPTDAEKAMVNELFGLGLDSTGLERAKKMTESEVQDGAGNLIPTDAEKNMVKELFGLGLDSTGLEGEKKMTEFEAHDGAGKWIPNDVEKALVKNSQMEDINFPKGQKSNNKCKGSPKNSAESCVDAYDGSWVLNEYGGSWEFNEYGDLLPLGEYEDALTISKATNEGRQENNNSIYTTTALRDDEKITDSEVQDGAGKLIPNDVEKSKVKDSQMDDTNTPKVENSGNASKERSKSSTPSNVDDYSSLCWSCSKTKTEVKLYKCAGCTRARYCSRGCIEHDWPHHKNWCIKQQKKKETKCSINN